MPLVIMSITKSAIIAGLAALLIEAFCFILVVSSGVFFGPLALVGGWLMYPSTYVWSLFDTKIGTIELSLAILFILGFLQFFLPFWFIVHKYGRDAA
jgi:hypothetical protein